MIDIDAVNFDDDFYESVEDKLLRMRMQHHGSSAPLFANFSINPDIHNIRSQPPSQILNIEPSFSQFTSDEMNLDEVDEDGDCVMIDASLYSEWRDVERDNWDGYNKQCATGFDDSTLNVSNDVEHGIVSGIISHLGRSARHKLHTAMREGKSRVRKNILIGIMEPIIFDYYMRLSGGGTRRFRPLTLTENGKKKKYGIISYAFENGNSPIFGPGNDWRLRCHYRIFGKGTSMESVTKRKIELQSIRVKCNTISWDVKIDFCWSLDADVLQGGPLDPTEEEVLGLWTACD